VSNCCSNRIATMYANLIGPAGGSDLGRGGSPSGSTPIDTFARAVSVYLSDLGRGGQALQATEEAIGIRRRLALLHPAAFADDLEQSLEAREWLLGLPPNRSER
jgi:hypothetical protein